MKSWFPLLTVVALPLLLSGAEDDAVTWPVEYDGRTRAGFAPPERGPRSGRLLRAQRPPQIHRREISPGRRLHVHDAPRMNARFIDVEPVR